MRPKSKKILIVLAVLVSLIYCQNNAIAMDLTMDMDCSQSMVCDICFFSIDNTSPGATILPHLSDTPHSLGSSLPDNELDPPYHPPR